MEHLLDLLSDDVLSGIYRQHVPHLRIDLSSLQLFTGSRHAFMHNMLTWPPDDDHDKEFNDLIPRRTGLYKESPDIQDIVIRKSVDDVVDGQGDIYKALSLDLLKSTTSPVLLIWGGENRRTINAAFNLGLSHRATEPCLLRNVKIGEMVRQFVVFLPHPEHIRRWADAETLRAICIVLNRLHYDSQECAKAVNICFPAIEDRLHKLADNELNRNIPDLDLVAKLRQSFAIELTAEQYAEANGVQDSERAIRLKAIYDREWYRKVQVAWTAGDPDVQLSLMKMKKRVWLPDPGQVTLHVRQVYNEWHKTYKEANNLYHQIAREELEDQFKAANWETQVAIMREKPFSYFHREHVHPQALDMYEFEYKSFYNEYNSAATARWRSARSEQFLASDQQTQISMMQDSPNFSWPDPGRGAHDDAQIFWEKTFCPQYVKNSRASSALVESKRSESRKEGRFTALKPHEDIESTSFKRRNETAKTSFYQARKKGCLTQQSKRRQEKLASFVALGLNHAQAKWIARHYGKSAKNGKIPWGVWETFTGLSKGQITHRVKTAHSMQPLGTQIPALAVWIQERIDEESEASDERDDTTDEEIEEEEA